MQSTSISRAVHDGITRVLAEQERPVRCYTTGGLSFGPVRSADLTAEDLTAVIVSFDSYTETEPRHELVVLDEDGDVVWRAGYRDWPGA